MTMTKQLTERQIESMRKVIDGADVYDYGTAVDLREVWRTFPGLVRIVKAKNAPKNGALRQPYFGAILTKKGRTAVA